jgi:sigma-B regulation protein RsbU (phosphoserine phosphatase)
MSAEERSEILKVLKGAIQRETNAFNYYNKGAEDLSMPASVRGLLARLAEEERRHRRLLMNEFFAVKKGWMEDGGAGTEHALSYTIPEELTATPLDVSADLEAFAVSLPSRLVGGDNIFSYVVSDRSGRNPGTLFFLYDVMGHSVATTEINALAARTVGEYMEESSSARMEKELLGPKKIVRLLNKRLNEQFDGEGVFLTMFCAYFDRESGMLSYTCAGHEPPFVIHENGKIGSLLHIQLMVGIDPEQQYRENKLPFEEGDALCVFSDGIIEARNRDDEMFGREKMADVLEHSWRKSPEEIVANILDGVRDYTDNQPMKDEVSIVVIKMKGGSAGE